MRLRSYRGNYAYETRDCCAPRGAHASAIRCHLPPGASRGLLVALWRSWLGRKECFGTTPPTPVRPCSPIQIQLSYTPAENFRPMFRFYSSYSQLASSQPMRHAIITGKSCLPVGGIGARHEEKFAKFSRGVPEHDESNLGATSSLLESATDMGSPSGRG